MKLSNEMFNFLFHSFFFRSLEEFIWLQNMVKTLKHFYKDFQYFIQQKNKIRFCIL